jgi:hypothetical protein
MCSMDRNRLRCMAVLLTPHMGRTATRDHTSIFPTLERLRETLSGSHDARQFGQNVASCTASAPAHFRATRPESVRKEHAEWEFLLSHNKRKYTVFSGMCSGGTRDKPQPNTAASSLHPPRLSGLAQAAPPSLLRSPVRLCSWHNLRYIMP